MGTFLAIISIIFFAFILYRYFNKKYKNEQTLNEDERMNIDANIKMAESLYDKGDFKAAIKYIDLALSINPNDQKLKNLKYKLKSLLENKNPKGDASVDKALAMREISKDIDLKHYDEALVKLNLMKNKYPTDEQIVAIIDLVNRSR